MIFYRLQHIPTRLYFCLSKKFKDKSVRFGYLTTNLSKTGKLYESKPTIKQMIRWLSSACDLEGKRIINKSGYNSITEEDILKIWKIVEVEL